MLSIVRPHSHDAADPRTVMELLGHTTIRQTMDRYGHALPERLRAAADAMDHALGQRTN